LTILHCKQVKHGPHPWMAALQLATSVSAALAHSGNNVRNHEAGVHLAHAQVKDKLLVILGVSIHDDRVEDIALRLFALLRFVWSFGSW